MRLKGHPNRDTNDSGICKFQCYCCKYMSLYINGLAIARLNDKQEANFFLNPNVFRGLESFFMCHEEKHVQKKRHNTELNEVF